MSSIICESVVAQVTIMPSVFQRRSSDPTTCLVCGVSTISTARSFRVCPTCLHERPSNALPFLRKAHGTRRAQLGLPATPPRSPRGTPCRVCANKCDLGRGERGYCGLRQNVGGRLQTLTTPSHGRLHRYVDRHVTNCCAAWFCPAGTGAGFPHYAYTPGPELGYANLAIFLYSCNFDCLFCQNATHRNISTANAVTVDALVTQTQRNPAISCWCFFGGSPEPQLPFAIQASKTALASIDRRLRICFEWNGCGHPQLVRRAAELAVTSGGTIKFDLKAWTPALSEALSGVPNTRAYENFAMLAQDVYPQRLEVPVLLTTTLLVPGYVDASEVESIAAFIADHDPTIPYSLLVFHPDDQMTDLPITPLSQVAACYRAAACHLLQVHIGNLQLLGIRTMNEFHTTIAQL